MQETRVIVCGGREFDNKDMCFRGIYQILKGRENIRIVSGHASGADSFGEEYAKRAGHEISVFPADWKTYGRAAGPIRNKQMLDFAIEEIPVIIAFWNGTSRGTKNMIEQAEAAGAEVHIFKY